MSVCLSAPLESYDHILSVKSIVVWSSGTSTARRWPSSVSPFHVVFHEPVPFWRYGVYVSLPEIVAFTNGFVTFPGLWGSSPTTEAERMLIRTNPSPRGMRSLRSGMPSRSVSIRVGSVRNPPGSGPIDGPRSEEHTSELQSRPHLVCRL